ncbi:MAG: hypothetical protein M3N07_02210 [Pseudomonadota bacterium]|nr:hypothetical protein [Pseudomonadota bacterium]
MATNNTTGSSSPAAGASDDPHAGPAREIGPEADADLHVDFDAELNREDAASPVGAEDNAEGPAQWRVAESLETLRKQINKAAPGRSKISDGGIGDGAHRGRNSDHNPWVSDGAKGVVTARDFTHDPKGGCDAGRLAEVLRQSKDPRIKYIISNKRIASSAPKGSVPAWTWRAYTGKNPHTKHVHLSVKSDKAHYDSTAPWKIDAAFSKNEGLQSDEAPGKTEFHPIEAALAAIAPPFAAKESGADLLPRLIALRDAADGLLIAFASEQRGGDRREQGGEELEGPADTAETPRPKFEELKAGYEQLYATCKVKAEHASVVEWHRNMLLKGRARYEEVEARIGVPWWFVGITHGLEASFSFTRHLHNGDPLSARTVQVPAGRPEKWNPPSDWVSSAVDAMTYDGFANAKDWSVARALYRWESFNGFGSRRKGINTPYLWSFSNHYSKGKYVRDHEWDPNAVSKQCGAAVMLKALQAKGDVKL